MLYKHSYLKLPQALLGVLLLLISCQKEPPPQTTEPDPTEPIEQYQNATLGNLTQLGRENLDPNIDWSKTEGLSYDGFYKDIFMDGGIRLTSRRTLPASAALSLSLEYFASSGTEDLNLQDTLIQNDLYIGNTNDSNGILLYPDGAPRFKMIYVNGGSATSHGNSLTESGRVNFRTFNANGGSYVGSCAGMFLTCNSTYGYGKSLRTSYLHIWPAYARSSGLMATYTGHFVEPGSPLLRYFDFGGDMYVDNIYHNGGGYAYEPWGFPAGTEILLRYDYTPLTGSGISIHREASSWAYKANSKSGRVVVIGSHPESITSGERLDLMQAMVLYALDGVGVPKVKGALQKGVTRVMDKRTEDNNPLYTKIGDKQYHHFTVNIPSGAKNVKVTLEGTAGYHLNLYMNRSTFAFAKDATYANNSLEKTKSIEIDRIDSGNWYISVLCATTIEHQYTEWGSKYVGNVSVLNGVSYSIKIDWE